MDKSPAFGECEPVWDPALNSARKLTDFAPPETAPSAPAGTHPGVLQANLSVSEGYSPGAIYASARQVVVPFLVTRVLVLLLASVLSFMIDSGYLYHYAFMGDAPLFTLSATFDANWYVDIAAHGYSTSTDYSQTQNYAFFPLYPIILRAVAAATGLSAVPGAYNVLGVALSHLFFFLALCALYLLTAELFRDKGMAGRTVWVACLLPWSFAYSMTYTESLFLLLTASALFVVHSNAKNAPRIGGTLAAGLLLGLSTLTRPYGLLAVLPAAWVLWRASTHLGMRAKVAHLAAVAIPSVSALVGFALFLAVHTGDPTVMFRVRSGGGKFWWLDLPRVLQLPPANPAWLLDAMETAGLITWLVMIIVMPWWARRALPASRSEAIQASKGWFSLPLAPYVVYAVLYLALTLENATQNDSWGRYMNALLPCLWLTAFLVARTEKPRLYAIMGMVLQLLVFAAAPIAQVTP